jgi:hypothetical protein
MGFKKLFIALSLGVFASSAYATVTTDANGSPDLLGDNKAASPIGNVGFSGSNSPYEGDWGRVSLGKGGSASRGSDRADLSGTDLIMNNDNRRNASLDFMSEGPNPNAVGIYRQVFRMYEGDRSQNRARYDSPVWGGFKFAVSNANTDRYAIGAAWANAEESDLQIRVAAGYTALDSFNGGTLANSFDQMQSISASVLLAGGFNFTAGYGSANNTVPGGVPGTEDPSNWQLKFGYTLNDIAVAIRYVDASDVQGRSGDDGSSVMIGAQWVANERLDVYGGYEVAKFDVGSGGGTVPAENLDILTVGLKMSF